MQRRWSDVVWGRPLAISRNILIGCLEGEGVGPQVVACALQVLRTAEIRWQFETEVRFGGAIGTVAEAQSGKPLSSEVIDFSHNIFADNGALFCGPGGDRFVYELRRHFDLFCKLAPTECYPELEACLQFRPEAVRGADILVVRENVGGAYFGASTIHQQGPNSLRMLEHRFTYHESDIRRIVEVAAKLAQQRRGKLLVVLKDGGLPELSHLWRDVALQVSNATPISLTFANVDLAAYMILQQPQALDVVVASNVFGDILVDLGGIISGSRGITYSGNFSPSGAAVYQTSHGAANDLVGKNIANPVGQIFALAMMLRQNFALDDAAAGIESAVRWVWSTIGRTADLLSPGTDCLSTELITDAICHRIAQAGDFSR